MAIYQDADIETMMVDWGSVLTAGELSAACLLEERDEETLEQDGGGAQITRRIVATIRVSDFPGLAANDPIDVDGVDYIVYRYLLLGDGALTELWLRLAGES